MKTDISTAQSGTKLPHLGGRYSLGTMKTVQLTSRDENAKVIGNFSGTFSEEDISLLSSYCEHMSRVRVCTLLQRGMPGITNMVFNQTVGFQLSCAPFTNPELYELLHVLRPITLESESASFYRACAVLTRGFADRSFSDHIKVLRRVYDDGELSLYMQFSLNNQPLLNRSLLHNFLNGTQYHTDAEKAAAWRAIEDTLSADNARALVMDQLYSKVKALFSLEYLCRLVLK